MQFKSIATPAPSLGVDYSNEDDLLVPDQSMSLATILERFTRGESVMAGKDVFDFEDEDENDIDFDKLKSLDLTEQRDLLDNSKKVQEDYGKQEFARKEKAKAPPKPEPGPEDPKPNDSSDQTK